MTVKRVVFSYLQPAAVALIVGGWAFAPQGLVEASWVMTAASVGTLGLVQLLEFVNERHAGWRIDVREFLTDVFYLVLYNTVILKLSDRYADAPLVAAKQTLGIATPWVMHLPFVAQVALTLVLVEFGQYWLHRLMHNSFLWWTHAPHHHITQLNALKGLVGNPLELFLVSLSVVALFDIPPRAMFCAFHVLVVVSAFAHANVRSDAPRWYGFVFTTVEAHSLHHTVGFEETRCNYANVLILLDRLFGTFRAGEAAVVGQDERKRLSIWEQLTFPLRPLLAKTTVA